jgi:hypothetical protein
MNRYRYIRPKPLLAKPFEWIMRGAYSIHLWLDGNSEWILLTFDEMSDIEISNYKNGSTKEFIHWMEQK